MDQPQIERILRLLQLLLGNRKNTTELANIIGCDIRTLQRYLDTLRGAGFIVEYHARGIPFLNPQDGTMKKISDLVHFTDEEAYILHKAIDSIDDNTTLKQNLKNKLYNIYHYPWLADVTVKPEQGENVHKLIEAIEHKKCVVLKKYRSANSNSIFDRIVEPYKFTTNYQQVWCYEPFTQSSKLFKVSRMGNIEVLNKNWKYEKLHSITSIDVFRISAEKYAGKAILKLNMRAFNLLVEEYPLAEQYIKETNNDTYTFDAPICSFEGVTRFILGLWDDIEIIGDENLIKFVNQKIFRIKNVAT